ncbi:hypothetical protein [Serratia marcescens]|uniref:hypothetical protein n=1 Tax=Serratia marcescens TaxID=615 RepID=UPI0011160AE9|nr:hypothetical protein [Serratia marcescens]
MNYIEPGVSTKTLARRSLIEKLGYYGFVECASLVNFLQLICDDDPGVSELRYILSKVKQCLDKYDNQSDYFDRLRALYVDIQSKINCEYCPLSEKNAFPSKL